MKSRKLFGFVSAAVACLYAGFFSQNLPSGLFAGETMDSSVHWQRLGPGGGGVIVDVIGHPSDPDIIWVVTDLTGIFKSIDGGVTYRRMSGPVERKEEFFEWMRGQDHELVYDPTNPQIMYWAVDGGIYTDPGLYKSIDGGETWQKIPGSPDLMPGAIVVDNDGVIYGIKHKNLYVSWDKGISWKKMPDVPTYYDGDDYDWRRRSRIFIYTGKNNTLYIGDRREDGGIWYSTDGGQSWHHTLRDCEIMDVACSPVTPGLVLALEQDGRIFRSSDGGAHFEETARVLHSYYSWKKWPAFFGGIAINKKDEVMAIGRWQMAFSDDGGKTFVIYNEYDVKWDPGDYIFPNRQTNRNLFKCNKLIAAPASDKWYFVDGHVVKISEDNGKSWTGRCNGIDILCVYTPPVIDQTNPDIIHVGAGDNGHYYTTDGGKSWISSEKDMRNVDGLAQDPVNPKIYYKLYGRGKGAGSILKSIDGGVTWKEISRVPMPGFEERSEKDPSFYSGWCGWLRVDPTNPQRLFVTHRAMDGLYVSGDGGKHFERALRLTRPWQLEVTPRGTVLICTWDSHGLFRSDDHGKTFRKIHSGKVHDFAVHPQNDDIIYINTGSFTHAWATARVLPAYERNRVHKDEGRGKLYKTTDGGKTWTFLGAYDGFALYIEPNYPNVMLMSTREGGQGIMRSSDGGKTWISVHDSHNNYHPRGFVYGGVPGRVYSWNHNLERLEGLHIDSLFVAKKADKITIERSGN